MGMGLSITEKIAYKRVARGIYRAMLVSAIAMESKFPGKKYPSDYGKLALLTRPNWKQVSETQFKYKDVPMNIGDGDSIISITKSVFATELYGTGSIKNDLDLYSEIVKYGSSVLDKMSI